MADGGALISARRRRTRDLLIEALSRTDAATRADLSRLTGLSASAVSDGIAMLHADGLIDSDQPARSAARGRGRRPESLRLRGPAGIVVGLDIGHAHVTAAVATTSGEVLAEHTKTLDVDTDPGRAFDAAVTLTRRSLRTAGVSMTQVVGIAAGMPRPVDRRTQPIAPAGRSDWSGIDPAAELRHRFDHPVVIGNDADMGARGERAQGAARGLDDFVYIKASHGIGAGLVLAGQTYRGSIGIAGEIGHTQVPGATEWCRCGSRGCLEAVVSISTVRRQLAHVLNETELPPLAEVSTDKAAARVITDAGRTLGRVLADLVNCLNPAAVILGGELGVAGTPLVAGVRESIDRYAEPASARAVTVSAAELGLRAELTGAVVTAVTAPTHGATTAEMPQVHLG
ncbi:MAG TPA: ROK family protein [Jatrophihabitantaceae bacterium]|nr:ROK family protein [Jatrophihabitantaceae bacterium]